MNRIEDDRVLFYLRHQQRIDEWAALVKEASETAHQFLCACEPDVAALADEFGHDVCLFASLDEAYPKLFLCRQTWFPDDKTTKSPRMGIGIEWQRSVVGFCPRGKSAYAGAWVHYQMTGGTALQSAVSRAFHDADLLKKHRLETSRMWWPAYRWEPAQGEFWNDLTSYRLQLIDSIRFFWKTCEPLVRDVLT